MPQTQIKVDAAAPKKHKRNRLYVRTLLGWTLTVEGTPTPRYCCGVPTYNGWGLGGPVGGFGAYTACKGVRDCGDLAFMLAPDEE